MRNWENILSSADNTILEEIAYWGITSREYLSVYLGITEKSCRRRIERLIEMKLVRDLGTTVLSGFGSVNGQRYSRSYPQNLLTLTSRTKRIFNEIKPDFQFTLPRIHTAKGESKKGCQATNSGFLIPTHTITVLLAAINLTEILIQKYPPECEVDAGGDYVTGAKLKYYRMGSGSKFQIVRQKKLRSPLEKSAHAPLRPSRKIHVPDLILMLCTDGFTFKLWIDLELWQQTKQSYREIYKGLATVGYPYFLWVTPDSKVRDRLDKMFQEESFSNWSVVLDNRDKIKDATLAMWRAEYARINLSSAASSRSLQSQRY